MRIEIKVPEVGESVREAVLVQWYKREGETVEKGELLFLIETDKVTLEIAAEATGVLRIIVQEGETVPVGSIVGMLDTEARPAEAARKEEREREVPEVETPRAEVAEPGTFFDERMGADAPVAAREPVRDEGVLAPSVRRLVAEASLDVSGIKATGPGGRITKGDVLRHIEESKGREEPEQPHPPAAEAPAERPAELGEWPEGVGGELPPETGPGRAPVEEQKQAAASEETIRKAMSPIRMRIAKRLLEAKQNTAMLTTFNEIDMSRVQAIRAQFKEAFQKRYGVSLGIMSFFIKSCIVALREFPEVNAFVDGRDIIYHNYYHIGVAIGGRRGLVVPVIRFADRLGFAQLEQAIVAYVKKVEENRLELADLEGGTFTISNGGVYGSLLSTPILNTPQSGILGMHKIENRPVAVEGQVVIRPMMYVALSYDHRIIDGREAVSCLKRIKECVEHPERIMVEI
jgi:2-oxoglutarate dehydrogenase E2 component (dihydrolipoamide succinyltransferase)